MRHLKSKGILILINPQHTAKIKKLCKVTIAYKYFTHKVLKMVIKKILLFLVTLPVKSLHTYIPNH